MSETQTVLLEELERAYLCRVLAECGTVEAGRQVLQLMMIVYDVCWTEEWQFLPREEAKEDVYFMKTTPPEMEVLLRYREMIQETARFAIMQRTLCSLLNRYGTSEAARQVFAVLTVIYGIPLRGEGVEG